MARIPVVADFNGDIFKGSNEGENLKPENKRAIYFLENTPVAAAPLQKPVFDQNRINDFYRANFRKHVDNINGISELENHKMCTLKMLIVKNGLASRSFLPENYHLKHTDCVTIPDGGAAGQKTPMIAAGAFNAGANDTVDAGFTQAVVDAIVENFTDLVCISAHYFKVRGHHWLDGAEVQYRNLMKKCQMSDDTIALLPSIENIFSNALHCIYPVVKAKFYDVAIVEGLCAGAMIKRHFSCPAGAAILPVLIQGYNDLKICAPGITQKMQKEVDYLQECMQQYNADPMVYSVNAQYYGKKRQVINEQEFGALAAVILSSVKAFQEDNALSQSKALQRVAAQAPITGEIITKSIKKIGQSEKSISALEGGN